MARVASSVWLVRKDTLRWVLWSPMDQPKRVVVSACTVPPPRWESKRTRVKSSGARTTQEETHARLSTSLG